MIHKRPDGAHEADPAPQPVTGSPQAPARASLPAPEPDLNDPALYVNRELALLEFNRRVLEQAKDPGTPLLERLRFLTICSTNLDEFFEIRVSGFKQQLAFGMTQTGPDGSTPEETLRRISAEAHGLVDEQYRVLNDVLLPALELHQIKLLKRIVWTPRQQRWIRRYFNQEVLPVLTPMGLDPAHPFPRILNKSLNFVVQVEGADAFGRDSGVAVVQVPRALPRLIALPESVADGPNEFVLLSSIVHAHVNELFPGMSVLSCHQFRVTRNSDLWVEEEEAEDLLHALKGELSARNFGDAVRLEVASDISDDVARFLLEKFELGPADLYRVNGPVNMHRLVAIWELAARPDLKYPPFVPAAPKRLSAGQDLFEAMRRGDMVLHHPFESFAPVLDLARSAATDPNVVAIKQTLYRTGNDSPMADALLQAAKNGKEVTAVIELRARFDEAANIDLAMKLQEAGAKVVYGIVGHKIHAKMMLVVRREGRRLRRYAHLGTGNYHVKTARAYTDISLFTCDRELCEDVHDVFMQMTGLGRVTRLRKLKQAPFHMQDEIVAMIEFEAQQARLGRSAYIAAKMNALVDPRVIQALYAASRAGVPIDLIVRGICALRPGVPGISETIRVRSIVGRFLEHSRVFHFRHAGKDLTWASSADWMQRNFYSRVETCFPILDERLAARVRDECLDTYLEDDSQAWVMDASGKYERARSRGGVPRSAQQDLLGRHAN